MPRDAWEALTPEERARSEQWKSESRPLPPERVDASPPPDKWQPMPGDVDPDAELPPVDRSLRCIDHLRARGALMGLVAAEIHAGGDGALARQMLAVAQRLATARDFDDAQPDPAGSLVARDVALVRAVALGVLLAGSPQRRWTATLADAAKIAGEHDLETRLTAVALAGVLAAAVREGERSLGHILAIGRSELDTAAALLARGAPASTIDAARGAVWQRVDERAPTGPFACVQARSFEEGVTMAARDGVGSAALAGALLGAILGRDSIPVDWVDRASEATAVRALFDELSVGLFVPMPTVV